MKGTMTPEEIAQFLEGLEGYVECAHENTTTGPEDDAETRAVLDRLRLIVAMLRDGRLVIRP